MSNKTQKYYFYEFLKILPAIALALIIFYFSSLSNPYPTAPSKFTLFFLNPMLHICEFGALSFLLFFGLFPKVRAFFLIILSIIYAFLDELHQYFVPFRYFDIFDFFLDIVGVIGGFVFYLFLKFILTRIKSKD
ncbi:MAG: VanZ family protein [Candidatus Lokiarchaeota archaeon]|nr:VanZ family protein [Candidatus Lokiarchaeota archaeon]